MTTARQAHRERARRYRSRQATGRLVATVDFTPETRLLPRLSCRAPAWSRAQIARAVHDLIANIIVAGERVTTDRCRTMRQRGAGNPAPPRSSAPVTATPSRRRIKSLVRAAVAHLFTQDGKACRPTSCRNAATSSAWITKATVSHGEHVVPGLAARPERGSS